LIKEYKNCWQVYCVINIRYTIVNWNLDLLLLFSTEKYFWSQDNRKSYCVVRYLYIYFLYKDWEFCLFLKQLFYTKAEKAIQQYQKIFIYTLLLFWSIYNKL